MNKVFTMPFFYCKIVLWEYVFIACGFEKYGRNFKRNTVAFIKVHPVK